MTWPPTKKLVKNIPDDLAHVLDRMLKKRVADRPQSAQEVLKELADRPLIAVPVAGVEDAGERAGEGTHLRPAWCERLATPQTLRPRGTSPAVNVGDAAMAQYAASAQEQPAPAKTVKTAARSKPAPPAFSKDWFNQQLGRPYVLYPLCALMICGSRSCGCSFGEPVRLDRREPEPIPRDVRCAAGCEGPGSDRRQAIRVPANPEGKYAFPAGPPFAHLQQGRLRASDARSSKSRPSTTSSR